MKINNQASNSNQSSSTDTQQFQINANGTAFQILSSGLYSNKVAAVLRELGCNAYDAHVAAGKKDVPIRVELPTLDNLTLVISDEGPGLSHEQVLSLYTTYFASNKRESNAFTGGLGLGSKSPFAYTNAFSVQSVHGGMSRMYSCAISENGSPTVTKLSEQATNQHSGVRVSMAVKSSDVALFAQEACAIFYHFDVRPIFNVPVTFPTFESNRKFHTSTYDIKVSQHWNVLSENQVKMGNVVYPIVIKELNMKSTHPFEPLLNWLPLLLRSPIGYIQVAASREALQYDPQSQKNIILLFQQAYQDIAQRYLDSANDPLLDNNWKKECALEQWRHTYLPQNMDKDVWRKYLNKTLPQHPMLSVALKVLSTKNVKVPTLAGSNEDVAVYWYDAHEKTRKNVENGMIAVGKNYARAYLNLTMSSTIIVVDDYHVNEKVKVWRNANNLPTTILVNPGSKKNMHLGLAHAKEISEQMGGVSIKLLSEMTMTNTVVKNMVKRDYIEVEDRMVSVFNLRTGDTTTMRLGDVPQNKRFVAIRDTDPTFSRKGEFYFQKTPEENIHAYNGSDMKSFSTFLSYAQKHDNVQWRGIEGWMEVRPAEYKQLKLAEQNVDFAIPQFIHDFMLPEHSTLRAYAATLWPSDNSNKRWNKNPWYTYESGWIGDITNAIVQCQNNNTAATILTILDEDELGELVRTKMRTLLDMKEQDNAFKAFYMVAKIVEENAKEKKVERPKTNSQWVEWMYQKYPMTENISSAFMATWASTTSPTEVESRKYTMLLRIALGRSV